MLYQFPIRIPVGWKLTVTQPFRSTELAAWYTAHHINMAEHNGVDVVCGDGPQTYGSACIWPFPFPGTVYEALVDAPVGATVHAHAQIDGIDPATGIKYSLIYLHLSSVTHSEAAGTGQPIVYHQGDVIGHIGNNGAVTPEPTPSSPFGGSHLHLGLGIKHPGELNATMSNPLLYLDIDNPFRGADDPTLDQPVYAWAAGKHTFNIDLSFGQTSDEVRALQTFLGISPATGYFGHITQAAVLAFQKAHGITPTGYVGPLTRAALNK